MRAILSIFFLFAVAACAEPTAAPAVPTTGPAAASAPAQDAGGYTVVITPPTAATAKSTASAPVM
jgi:hypothetical protein